MRGRCALVGVLGLLTLAQAAGAAADRLASFDAYAQERLDEWRVAGAAVAIIEQGAIVHRLQLGEADTETGAPVTAATRFQVGSISKPVAAWVVMTLVAQGRVDLDRPISAYVKSWQLPESTYRSDEVTVRRVLSHTAGLSLGGYPGFRRDKALPTTVESLGGATNGSGSVEIFAEPGEAFSYSGGGYTLLQLLVEDLTGMPFDAYAQGAVLDPLGMHASSYLPSAEALRALATPHGVRRDPTVHHHFRAQAAASLHSTADDLARFIVANFGDSPAPLGRDLILAMHQPIAEVDEDTNIGMGFFLSRDGALVGHSGSNLGWKAHMQFAPGDRSGIVVLTNSESGGAFGAELVCRWDRDFGPGALAAPCAKSRDEIQALRSQTRWGALALSVVAGLGAAAMIGLLMLGTLSLVRPRGLRAVLAFGGIALGGLFALFFYTPWGALVIAGMPTPFMTIDHLPPGFLAVSLAGLALWLVLLGATAVRKRGSARSG